MNQRKQIMLMCPVCNNQYSKDKSEYTRNLKIGRISYCSISCATTIQTPNKVKSSKTTSKKNLLKGYNRSDSLSPYRYYLKSIKNSNRSNHFNNDITLEDLKKQWELQEGICPYTGIKLIHQIHSMKHTAEPFYLRGSLDRIDSSKGYTADNIEFVSLAINLMKNKFSKSDVISFLKLVSDAKSGY
jgi:hypothetical protein